MHALAQEALRRTVEPNSRCHTPEEVRERFSRIIGKLAEDRFCRVPPFRTGSGNPDHIRENTDLYGFAPADGERAQINALDGVRNP